MIIGLTGSFLTTSPLFGGESAERVSHAAVASAGGDLFELSLGYNYIHLDRADIEQEHLHGGDVSAFVNITSWLGLGGDFMANFGQRTQRFFFNNVDLDSERLVYVFGPRVTVWQNPQFRLFTEVLAGGVHAELKGSVGSISRTFHDDAFAMAIGAGADWRFTRHFAWRIIQADCLPTNLGDNWQHNIRLSTAIVFSFGGRQ
jgi:hypothetical protein